MSDITTTARRICRTLNTFAAPEYPGRRNGWVVLFDDAGREVQRWYDPNSWPADLSELTWTYRFVSGGTVTTQRAIQDAIDQKRQRDNVTVEDVAAIDRSWDEWEQSHS